MKVKAICEVCGGEFEAKSVRAKYCSEKCRAIARAEAANKCYKTKVLKAIKEDTKKCAICGREFVAKNNKKYCSKSCAWKAKQEKSQKKDVGMAFGKGSICWDCNWCTGKERKCPWVRKFEPVPGWVAEKKKLKIYKNTYTESYVVKSCPLFEGWRKNDSC